MKKILLSSVALLGLTVGAVAADLPSRRAPAPVVSLPVFTWTGFYLGVNAGYGWSDSNDVVINGVRFNSNNDGGFVGGGQLGFNYQMGAIVIGLEGDLQWADLGGRSLVVNGVRVDSSNDWFGTIRGRAGVAVDRALIYATGGFAFTDGDGGWALGGGLEYAFTNNLSAKIEGLYVSVDNGNNVVGGGNDEFGVIRAGLNFRFATY